MGHAYCGLSAKGTSELGFAAWSPSGGGGREGYSRQRE